jgi:hypothetical protein
MRCEPANSIIKKFNGLTAVAEIANVTPHTVMRWRRTREDGGTGGVIPHWHMGKLLEAAREKNIDLAPTDFLPTPSETQRAEA